MNLADYVAEQTAANPRYRNAREFMRDSVFGYANKFPPPELTIWDAPEFKTEKYKKKSITTKATKDNCVLVNFGGSDVFMSLAQAYGRRLRSVDGIVY